MRTLIVYDSQFGNTEQIARTVGERLGSARLIRAEEVGSLANIDCDLLIVAGPTHRHGMSAALRILFESMPRGALKNVPTATFDTRYRMSPFLSGSAAARIASKLKRGGARLVVPPKSFFMKRDVPPQGEKRRHGLERLEAGEETQVVEWAMSILEHMEIPHNPPVAK